MSKMNKCLALLSSVTNRRSLFLFFLRDTHIKVDVILKKKTITSHGVNRKEVCVDRAIVD